MVCSFCVGEGSICEVFYDLSLLLTDGDALSGRTGMAIGCVERGANPSAMIFELPEIDLSYWLITCTHTMQTTQKVFGSLIFTSC